MKNTSTPFSTLDQFSELSAEELEMTKGGDTHLLAGLWDWLRKTNPRVPDKQA